MGAKFTDKTLTYRILSGLVTSIISYVIATMTYQIVDPHDYLSTSLGLDITTYRGRQGTGAGERTPCINEVSVSRGRLSSLNDMTGHTISPTKLDS